MAFTTNTLLTRLKGTFLGAKPPRPKELYKRCIYIDGPQSEGFLNLMSDVWTLINTEQSQILKDRRFDLSSVANGESSFIWFTFSEKNNRYDLPYDIAFAEHLPHPLLKIILQRIKSVNLQEKLKLKIGRLQDELAKTNHDFEDLKIFEELGAAEKNLKEIKLKATTLRNHPHELIKYLKKIEVPIGVQFQWLILGKVLAKPSHPLFQEKYAQLKHSYFRGRLEPFYKNLDMVLMHLNTIREEIFRSCEAAIEFIPGNDHQDSLAGLEGPLETQYLFRLQRLPFTEMRKSWNADRYKYKLTRLNQALVSQKNAERLAFLLYDLHKKSIACMQIDSPIYSNLEAEKNFEIRTHSDTEQAFCWIEENTIKLLELLYQSLQECHRRRLTNPNLVFPAEITKTLDNSKDGPKPPDQMLAAEFRRQLQRLTSIMHDNGQSRVKDLIGLYHRVENELARLIPQDLETWFAGLRNLQESQRYDHYRENFHLSQAIGRLLQDVKREIENLFQEPEEITSVKPEFLEDCLQIVNRQRLCRFQVLDLGDLDIAFFLERRKEAQNTKNPDQRLRLLYWLHRSIAELPPKENLVSFLESWRSDLPREDFSEMYRYISRNNALLGSIQTRLLKAMRNVLSESDGLCKRIRWTALGVWRFSWEYFDDQLKTRSGEIPRIINVRDGSTASKYFSQLSQKILKAQSFSRSQKVDWSIFEEQLFLEKTPCAPCKAAFEKEFKDNAAHLFETSKKAVDMAHYQARSQQARFDNSQELEHLELSLSINDISAITKNFGLRTDCSQEDIQLFGRAYKLREDLFRKAPGSHPSKSRNRDCNGKTFRSISALEKLQILNEHVEYMTAEVILIQRFLNFARSTMITKTQTFMNLLELFQTIKHRDCDYQAIRKFRKVLVSQLNMYEPANLRLNFEVNRDTFFAFLYRIVGDKLEIRQ